MLKSSIVGVPRFELGTPCSQSRCANRTALHPELLSVFLNCGAKLRIYFEMTSNLEKFFQKTFKKD